MDLVGRQNVPLAVRTRQVTVSRTMVSLLAALLLTMVGCGHGTGATDSERAACASFRKVLRARWTALNGEQHSGVNAAPPSLEPTPAQLSGYRTEIEGFARRLDDLSGGTRIDADLVAEGRLVALVATNNPAGVDPRHESQSAVDAFARFANDCGRLHLPVQ
jgi:hypothetical protein